VDYGSKSLEVIFLLLLLKLEHPDQVHVLRGWHEDKRINFTEGLFELCNQFFGDTEPDDPNSMFFRINRVFEVLPLAALLDDKILCLHRGIGNTYLKVDELDKIIRPCDINAKPKTALQNMLFCTVSG
jgi:protein phosphatase